ncbi:MAG TPA: hypothetical protein VFG83_11225 [Kofleriaceae bacterium]|nr:hypothetical protein [Kofleriaceae bacterium]
MGLDIRLPIGLMFGLIGLILTVYGVTAPAASQALGHNVNLVWGLCILAFGTVMLASWKLFPTKPRQQASHDDSEPSRH